MGLVGFADFDLVAALFGDGSVPARAVYVLVGLSAAYQVIPPSKPFQIDEPPQKRRGMHRMPTFE